MTGSPVLGFGPSLYTEGFDERIGCTDVFLSLLLATPIAKYP
jgi:hypothetical protein